MNKSIIFIILSLLFVSTIFAYNLNTTQGIESSIQEWYTLTTGNNMSTDTVKYMAGTIIYSSNTFNIPIETIMGIIAVESSFIPNATNGISIGLMQIQPNTLIFVRKRFNMIKENLNDTWYNIVIGTEYLSFLKSLNLTNQEMIEDYNGGVNKIKYYYMVEHAIHEMKSWGDN